tara:strand:- start:3469 stop:3642 length:174 start_codon:yes stop_codon:yes gene_type:complete
MYNITEIKNESIKLIPIKDWKWKPKTELEISKKDALNFRGFITSRRIGSMTYHGQGF